LRWLVNRQQTGFNGRPNKLVDACYSFWVGSTLALLGATELVDRRALRAFLLLCESTTTGGFGKDPEAHPDPLHSYMSLAGLSLQGEPGVAPLDPGALAHASFTASRYFACHFASHRPFFFALIF
jgi:geranylgeranyl transferase type-1 subunit beta